MKAESTRRRVYDPLIADLEEGIRAEIYRPGSCLPSESELCRSHKISRASVRAALAELEDKGLVFKRAGKGTFVQFPGPDGPTPVLAPIGITSPSPPNSSGAYLYLTPVREAIADMAFALGYRIEWVHAQRLDLLERGELSGLICVSWPEEAMGELNQIADRGVPVVAVNRRPEPGPVNAVLVDHQKWARKAVEYLVHLGHREIAFVTAAPGRGYTQERLAGYRAAIEAAGGALDPGLTWRFETAAPDEVCSRVEAMLSARKPSALFVADGACAGSILTALHRLGHAVPADISVLVYDDVPNPLYPIVPALTAVRQPLAELGNRCVTLLDRIRRNRPTQGVVETVAAELVVRESCRELR